MGTNQRKNEIMNNLPKTWEEFCEENNVRDCECKIQYSSRIEKEYSGKRHVEFDRNNLPNKETAEAFLALMQLIQLRDCYRQGWVPNWNDYSIKYNICSSQNRIISGGASSSQSVLSFQTKELRDQFFENFKDLIEQAKGLI